MGKQNSNIALILCQVVKPNYRFFTTTIWRQCSYEKERIDSKDNLGTPLPFNYVIFTSLWNTKEEHRDCLAYS